MLKGIMTFIVVISVWIFYTILGATSCDRVVRAAEPFRTGMSIVHWALKPWADMDQRWWLTNVAFKFDKGIQNVIAIQIYGQPLDQVCIRKAVNPSQALPPPVPQETAPKK